MTANQIAYMRAIEEARHNRAAEENQNIANAISQGQLARQKLFDQETLRDVDADRLQRWRINRSGLINAMDIAKMKSDTDISNVAATNYNTRVIKGMELGANIQMNNARIRSNEKINAANLGNTWNIAVLNNQREDARNRERVQGSITSANIAADAAKYGAKLSSDATKYGARLSSDATRYMANTNASIKAADRAQQQPLISAQAELASANASRSSADAWLGWNTNPDQARIVNQNMQSGEMRATADTFGVLGDIIGRYTRALVPIGPSK